MRKLFSLFAALTLSVGLWAETVSYLYPVYNEGDATKGIQKWETTTVEATAVTSSTAAINAVTWGTAGETTWFVVKGTDVQLTKGAVCAGDVRLILADNAKLTAKATIKNAGIQVSNGNSLTIYAQSTGTQMGQLIAECSTMVGDNAGIGGSKGIDGSNITINGGIITATGGKQGAAGIGGGYMGSGTDITINGGTVTATGGQSGAGIGGGGTGSGSYITINGGTVMANGGENAAGIGGGSSGSGSNITILAGTVTATGADGGAGIGSGKSGAVSSNIFVATKCIVKAGDSANPTDEIAKTRTATTDIASDLAGKQYATIAPKPAPAVGDQFVDETSGLKFEITAIDPTATVKVINNDYEGTSYTIPASVSYKDVAFAVTEIGDGAFINCSDLTTITFAEGSQVTTIGEAAFNECWSLISIALPSSVTTIGPSAFSGCSELPSINLASVTEIGVLAFMGCEQLSSLDIPASLTTIGENAFILCENIYDVTVHWESATQLPIMGNGVFGGIAGGYGPAGATLHVPAGSASVYDVDPWNTFGTIDDPQFVLSDKTAGQYATICLPQPIASVSNAVLYKISYGDVYKVNFVEETNFTADPAGTPYLVQAIADGDIVFTMTDATPVDAPIDVQTAKGFVASLQEEMQAVPEGYEYLLVSGGALHSAGAGCLLSKNHAYIDVNYVPETEPEIVGAPRRVTLYNAEAQSPTGLRQSAITNHKSAMKVVKNGQFVIIRDNMKYNAQGVEIQ